MDAFFEKDPKKCSAKCLDEYEGKALRAVYGQNTRKCIYFDLYNSVVVVGAANKMQPPPTKGENGCKADEYAIEIFGDKSNIQCLQEEFVKHILGIK